jgi:hypothetical protein
MSLVEAAPGCTREWWASPKTASRLRRGHGSRRASACTSPNWATLQCATERRWRRMAGPATRSRCEATVYARFLDPGTAAVAAANAHCLASVRPGQDCAGYEYPAVAEGEEDLVFFWRTSPRDHVPGVLLVYETGGAAIGLDGTAYRPGTPGRGLLVTSAEAAWPAVNGSLFLTAHELRPGGASGRLRPARPPKPAEFHPVLRDDFKASVCRSVIAPKGLKVMGVPDAAISRCRLAFASALGLSQGRALRRRQLGSHSEAGKDQTGREGRCQGREPHPSTPGRRQLPLPWSLRTSPPQQALLRRSRAAIAAPRPQPRRH